MKTPTLLAKVLNYWKRRAFRQKLYQQSQCIEPNHKSAIVFAPHQDDETLGCGGVIALKRKQGVAVKVVFLTDGRNCYHGAPAPIPISTEQCIQTRQQEALAALQTLGISASDVIFLKHQDSSLGQLQAEQRQAAIEELRALLQQFCPQEVYVPYFKDMHGDHIETYHLVREALKTFDPSIDVWQYLVWSLWCYEYLDDLVENKFSNLYRVAIDRVQQQKNEALRAYRSQYIPIVKNFTALPKTFLKFFDTSYELFVKASLDN
ncbi:hypothetical protein C7B61_20850 [filamentous cyanobacterium CCP1]|nr:hypothetical protein C7B76_27565 [filamentous cyanobacterium CCP2]PSB56055.1 hypothetical protein C7B61_20850 [filamentous cyanobacterium CCP1]